MDSNVGRMRRLMTWVERAAAGAVVVALVALAVVAVIRDWSAGAWAALAAWTTAAVAIAAGLIALRQLAEARRLRVEQAQPYVVAYMEPSAADPMVIDLIMRNFGTTAAHDVAITINPPPERKAGVGEDAVAKLVWVPPQIPVLVPGQEWRTLWDTGLARVGSGLPDRHEAVVTFTDSQGRSFPPLRSVLDWSSYWQREQVTVYGPHHSAKALREISATIKRWRETSGGLAVVVRDGDAKDERNRQHLEARRAARDAKDNGEAAS